eukprot:1151567-Pelagomonas_calceolata.AAC.1
MSKSSEHVTGPFMAPAYRIWQFVRKHALGDRPHVPLWLGKAHLVTAGMYASQVWGTELVKEGQEFSICYHMIKMYNGLLNSNCETLRKVLKADLHFAQLQGPLMLDCSDPGWLSMIAAECL